MQILTLEQDVSSMTTAVNKANKSVIANGIADLQLILIGPF